MAQDHENLVTKIRLTNSVGRELVFKIGWMYLDRKEFLYSTVGFPIAAILVGLGSMALGHFNAIATMAAAPLGIIGAMQFLSIWRARRPSSYMWDTFHKLGLPLVLGEARGRLPVFKKETIFVPDLKPSPSKFIGTSDEALALIENYQTQYGMPNWCERSDDGTVSPMILRNNSLIGVILIESMEEGDGPAPDYHRDADPILERGECEADLINPRTRFRRVMKPVPWKEML